MSPSSETSARVAVVGMAGKFPGAADLDRFWRNLREGVESVTTFEDDELLAAGVEPETLRDPSYVKARGVLEGADLFDAGFFGFSPREAEVANPQLRLMLEGSWTALENAGIDPGRYEGEVGVFIGGTTNRYLFNLLSDPEVMAATDRFQLEIGNDRDHLATQVSYHLDLRGPSVTVQTGCSTSLVAVHLAAQSLLYHECDLALAGGISITVPQVGYRYLEGGVSSPDGHCRAFDAEARGTVNGSGFGLVVLRRLEDAVADRDPIRGVILGSALNNDGSGKAGYTAPSAGGQARVIEEAQAIAGVRPGEITYVEAHGTGTPLGDPVEVAALTRAFEKDQSSRCGLGSVKTNVGHLNAGAGVVGLIKTVLMLEHGELVPSLHFERPNPELRLDRSPFYVVGRHAPWPRGESPRRAGVSSFGIGGTNAHVVVEEPPPPWPPQPSRRPQLLVLSARSPRALERLTVRLAEALEGPCRDQDLGDVAYTLQVGRKAFRHRCTLVAEGSASAARALRRGESAGVRTRLHEPGFRPVIYLFPGQGRPTPAAVGELYRTEPELRGIVDRCSEIAEDTLGGSLAELLAPPDERAAEAAARTLRHADWAQLALFTLEYALARLWTGWVGEPAGILGHSLGEWAAACVAGVMPLEAAVELVAVRGRATAQAPPGAMLAVGLPEPDVRELLVEEVSVAALNGERVTILAGAPGAVDAQEAALTGRRVSCRRLDVDRAFHSPLMEGAAQVVVEHLERLELEPPRLPFFSCRTGTWITDDQACDPAYWGRQMVEPVRFADALDEVFRDPDRLLLELGPGDDLTRLVRRRAAGAPAPEVHPVFGDAEQGGERSGRECLLETLGGVWLAGVEVGWRSLHQGFRRRLPLPGYPFEHQSYWVGGRGLPAELSGRAAEEPGPPVASRPGRDRPETARELVHPAEGTERVIADLWQQLFGFEPVGAEDDFFALGGHSLLAVQLVNRLRDLLGVDLSLGTLFEAPTVRGLASVIDASGVASGDREGVELEALIEEVEGLSAREIERAMAEEADAEEDPAPAGATPAAGSQEAGEDAPPGAMAFSLFFFSADASGRPRDHYRLVTQAVRLADRAGFEAVWTPERHFQAFGGLYPNPSVLSAALGALSERLRIRAGSLVLPLHDPVRVAEDWALLDNLTGGRVGVSFASGWHPDDFALSPHAFKDRKEIMFRDIETIRRLWAGGAVRRLQGSGEEVELRILPRPVQPELPIWITSSGSEATWRRAGEIGANVLATLRGEPEARLAHLVRVYRRARREHGHAGRGGVTLMLHTFLGRDLEAVRETVRPPLTRYLRTFVAQGQSMGSEDLGVDPERLDARDEDHLAGHAFERIFRESSLLGTPDTCARMVGRLRGVGVDEIACQIDFGLDPQTVLSGLELLSEVREDLSVHPGLRVAP